MRQSHRGRGLRWLLGAGAFIAALAIGARLHAATALLELWFAPDIPASLDSSALGPNQLAIDNFSGSVSLVSFPSLPANVHITGYYQVSTQLQLLSFDTAVTLPSTSGTISVMPRDVASFDGAHYAIYFAGASNDIPRGANIEALTMINGDLAIALDVAATLPGPNNSTLTVYPCDLVALTGSAAPFRMIFDGRLNGIPAGINLGGAYYLASNGHLLLSFDGTGAIGTQSFTPDRVLEFDPSNNLWALVYDAQAAHPGFAPAQVRAVFAVEPSPSPTMTQTPTTIATVTPTPTATLTPTATATPTPVPVGITVSSTRLFFSKQVVGTTSTIPRVVYLRNPLTRTKLPVQIENVSITPPGEYQFSNGCPASLASGQRCPIGVLFQPAQLGRRIAILEIATNARDSLREVKLAGTGVLPAIKIQPARLGFGRNLLGVPSPLKTVTLVNSNSVPVQIDSIQMLGGASGDFSVSNCTVINAQSTCTLNVTFTPTARGRRSARIVISDGARRSPQHVSLSGYGH
ncbi:MAG: choice-of-anchor D domain-containing protein [Candidatus Binataceae bacterium]|nr:choice-of-anchor D domain-containing protein [Candidatus Binataceae bacterium]